MVYFGLVFTNLSPNPCSECGIRLSVRLLRPLAQKSAQFLAIVNTLLSLLGAVLSVFATSALVGGRFNMVHIQNSTLAGGVAMGAACTLRLTPGGALAVGLGAGAISTLGFQYLMPFLDRTIGLGDTCGEAVISFVCAHNSTPLSRPAITDCCALPLPASTLSPHPGVHNLHGIPAIVGTLVAGLAALGQHPDYLEHDTGRQQLGYQVLAGVVTMGIAIAGGLLGGFVVSWFNPCRDETMALPEVSAAWPPEGLVRDWREWARSRLAQCAMREARGGFGRPCDAAAVYSCILCASGPSEFRPRVLAIPPWVRSGRCLHVPTMPRC